MTTPDYKIIGDCLEKVVRPTREPDDSGIGTRLKHLGGHLWAWVFNDPSGKLQVEGYLDEPDALAVIEKAVRGWLSGPREGQSRQVATGFHYDHWSARLLDPFSEELHQIRADDETTALCLLALRVAGEEA